MKIYVSGSLEAQARLRKEATLLWEQGHEVTSSWLAEQSIPPHLTTQQFWQCTSITDIAEVYASDCIICDVNGPSTSGRAVEWGLCIAPRVFKLKILVSEDEPRGFMVLHDLWFPEWVYVHEYLREKHPVAGKGIVGKHV